MASLSDLTALIVRKHARLEPAHVEPWLRALLKEVREKWPEVPLDDTTFVAHVAERLPADDPARALDELHGSDLFVACACANQLAPAIAALERDFLPRMTASVRRIDPSPDFVDEARQRLRERLLVGTPSRIAEYSGAGPLEGWMRVAAMRVALNLQRENRRKADLRPDPAPAHDPEIDLINVQYSAEVEASFRGAFARLPEEYRALLRLYYLNGMSQDQIAQDQKVERSTLSRRIAAARRFLLTETHRELQRLVPAITTASRDSLLVALRSHIDVSLESLLRR